MATFATMPILNTAKTLLRYPSPSHKNPKAPHLKPIPTLSLHTLPKSPSTLLAGAFFASLSASDAAFAAQRIADVAEGDNRGLALLIPIVPAVLWVLYNILQPALNQLNRMRSEKGFAVGLGIAGGGLAAAGLVSPKAAQASDEVLAVAVGAAEDSRGLLLLFVVLPAVAWVLYNILQPALTQINRMRSG